MRCSVSELPSCSVQLREQHIAFYNRVWAKDDPFWDDNQPGNLWNCKCDWQQVDDPVTDGNPKTAIRHQGLEGNPAKTGQIFTDNSSYVKKVGNTNAQRKKQDIIIANAIRPAFVKKINSEIRNSTTICKINGIEHDVTFLEGLSETAQSMQGTTSYWLKNEVLSKIPEHIKNGQYICRFESDVTHNTRKSTLRLKRNTDWFYYFKTYLPDGTEAFINIGHYKSTHPNLLKSDKYYFYTITKQLPSY